MIPEGEMKASIIADMSLRDVQFTEVDGVISGTFSLRGNLGQQNRIVTGVLARDATGKIVDIAPLEKSFSVKEGVIDIRSFSYRLPKYLSGKVTLFIQAETEGGVLLGSQKILERDFPVKESLFRCSNEGSGMALSCVSSVNRAVLVSYYGGSFFSEPVKTNEVVFGEAPTTLATDLPAGPYMVLVLDVETGERRIFSIRMVGSYGAIVNAVVFSTEHAGELGLTVATRMSSLKGAQVAGTLVGNDGKPCGSGFVEGTTSVFDLSLVSTCTMGTLKVELKDASGQVLDTLEEPFRVTLPATVPIGESVPSQPMTTESPVTFITIIVIVLVLLIGVGLWFFMRRRPAKVIAPLFFLFTCFGLFGTMAPKADALSWILERYSPDRAEWAWTCDIAVDLDKTIYAQGESATISVVPNAHFYNDAGADMGQAGNCSAVYGRNSANTTAAFDSEPIGSFVEIARASGTAQWPIPVDIWFSGSKAFTIPGAMSVGVHSVRSVTVGMGAPCYVSLLLLTPCSGTLAGSGSLNFTVATVDVRF
jgi:hypothetical protein